MTDKENNVVQQHFDVFQGMEQDLAGRTLHMDSFGFGIIILEVHSEEKTIALLENNPEVKESILTATIFPYRVALLKK